MRRWLANTIRALVISKYNTVGARRMSQAEKMANRNRMDGRGREILMNTLECNASTGNDQIESQ